MNGLSNNNVGQGFVHMRVIMHMMKLCTNIFGNDQVCHSN
jgi:hypothetical protein